MLTLPLVLLCGGLATRLRSLTNTIPKSLIKIADHPFIHHQLTLLSKNGFKDVYLCVGHQGEMIQNFVGDGSFYGLNVYYSYDGESLLGTGGSLKKLLKTHPLDSFFVMYGDSYLPCPYAAIESSFFENAKMPLMAVYKNDNLFDVSNIEFDGRYVTLYDKQAKGIDLKYIDYGLSILNGSDLTTSVDTFDLSTILQKKVTENTLRGFEIYNRFYEIGSIQGINDTELYIRSKL